MLKLRQRRLRCPEHGVLAESVPFARPGSGFTRDFEELVVWLATKCDKNTVSVFCRVAWRTLGAMRSRIVAERLDDDRLSNLVDIGVDEISWRKHHKAQRPDILMEVRRRRASRASVAGANIQKQLLRLAALLSAGPEDWHGERSTCE